MVRTARWSLNVLKVFIFLPPAPPPSPMLPRSDGLSGERERREEDDEKECWGTSLEPPFLDGPSTLSTPRTVRDWLRRLNLCARSESSSIGLSLILFDICCSRLIVSKMSSTAYFSVTSSICFILLFIFPTMDMCLSTRASTSLPPSSAELMLNNEEFATFRNL